MLFLIYQNVWNNKNLKSTNSFKYKRFKYNTDESLPTLLWSYDKIGNGYSSPAVSEELVFITGEVDSLGYLFSFDIKGKLLWRKTYGKEWTKKFGGTRAQPTIKDSLLYICSGYGKIICFNKYIGIENWSVDMINDLNGKNIVYGYSMNLALSGDLLYCFPGGKENNIVALNRFTGKTEWTSKGVGELAGYGSPLVFKKGKRKILTIFSEYSLLGLDASSGKLLWQHALNDMGEIPCNTPIYDDGHIYYVAGPGNGAVKLQLSADGSEITEVWKNAQFDTYYGGIINLGGYIYGAMQNKRNLSRISMGNGKIDESLSLGKGSITTDGEMIYYYTERGDVHIIKQENGSIKSIATFEINKGSKEHFAHPVVIGKRLYIRHGKALMVYKLPKIF